MYLLILESIGTSELLLIGLVALIFFGPRKLPDLARTFGKVMNEFRRSSNEFKQTWEREVASEVNQFKDETSFKTIPKNSNAIENSAEKNTIGAKEQFLSPEIKEVSQEDFHAAKPKKELEIKETTETKDNLASKQNWL